MRPSDLISDERIIGDGSEKPPTPATKVQNRVLTHQRDVFLKVGSCMGGGESAALGATGKDLDYR
jgi:hypothetical protein